MMRSIVSASLRFRVLVVFVAAALVATGWRRAHDIPVDVFPEFAPPVVEVQTEAPGLSTEEVDELVTVPLESALIGSQGVAIVRSKSVLGLSSIVLVLGEDAEPLATRQSVQERLSAAARQLPASVKAPVMLPALSALSRVMKIGVSSDTMSMADLSDLVRWTVRPRLMGIPGVVNVAVWGQRDRELQVRVDPELLAARGVTLEQVVTATRDAAAVGAGGFLDTPNQRLTLVADLAVRRPEDLARVPVLPGVGAPRLGDVARIQEGEAPLIGEGVVNDGPGLLLIVEKEPAANTLSVTRAVEEALEKLQPALTGVAVDPTIFRPATFVEMSIDNLSRALLIGVLLVAAVLSLFLFDWRTAAISMTALPVSLVVAVLVLDAFGRGLNTMILAGLVIALGEVVDDAIIDVENIARRLREARSSGLPFAPFRLVLAASMEVRGAVVYGTLIIVLVMLPVFFLEGLAGAFFRPLAWAYVLAILASLGTALTLTPALSLLLLRKASGGLSRPPLVRAMVALYRPILGLLLRFRLAAPVLALLSLPVVALLAKGLGEDFMPRFREYDFLMHWVEKPGTGVDASRRITERVSRELRAIPGVRNFGAHIGRAEVADEVVGPDFTELWISLDPDVDYDATVAEVAEVIDGYPGLYRDLLTYLKERIKEVLSGASASIVIRIHGPDLGTLRQQADAIEALLVGTPGLIDLHVEPQVLVPRLHVTLDPAALERHGVTPRRIRDTLSTLVDGAVVGTLFEGQRVLQLAVRGEESVAQDPLSIARLGVDLPGGGTLPLSELADVSLVPSPNVIKREGGSRRIDVSGNVQGVDLAAVANEVERRLREHDFPRGYHPELLGEYTAQREARQRLLSLAALSLLGIVVLLYSSLRSVRSTLMIFFGLPFAVAGGVVAVWLGGGVLSLGSFIGFVTVLGVGARNSIMLIDHYRHLELEEAMDFGPELVRRGAEERLAPILMTVLTTALALVPIVAAPGRPGTEIEHPMAVVILAGLISATLLNLFVLPPLYLAIGRGAAVRPLEDSE